jgi:hypothetical protein
MGMPAEETIALRDFEGLQSRPDPNDIPPGAATRQVNVTCIVPGQLTSRPGTREVSFEE